MCPHGVSTRSSYDGLGFDTLAFNNVSGIGRGGTSVLKIDDKEVARKSIELISR
jgi:arylsulfatase